MKTMNNEIPQLKKWYKRAVTIVASILFIAAVFMLSNRTPFVNTVQAAEKITVKSISATESSQNMFPPAQARTTYKIGVLAKRGGIKAMTKWGWHGAYLSETLGTRFIIVPLKFTSIDSAIKNRKIDFILANPSIFIEMQEKYGLEAVATMINKREGKSLDEFGGVLLVAKNSSITKLADIRGKRFGFVKHTSFGGLHTALYLLHNNGIDPKKDCSRYAELKTHDKVVMAVKNGDIDVGTVRTDTLERMADEGKIKMSDFRILNKVEDDFPFVHSTRLYPEWPLSALSHIEEKTTREVGRALVALGNDSKPAQKAKITGWQEPADYGPVLECLWTIKVGVFADQQ